VNDLSRCGFNVTPAFDATTPYIIVILTPYFKVRAGSNVQYNNLVSTGLNMNILPLIIEGSNKTALPVELEGKLFATSQIWRNTNPTWLQA